MERQLSKPGRTGSGRPVKALTWNGKRDYERFHKKEDGMVKVPVEP